MILLDTDMLTLLLQGEPRVQKRIRSAETDAATTIVTWMEVMQGRFRAIFSAADADQLERGSRRLQESASQLSSLPIVPINRAVAKQFAARISQQQAQTDRSRGHIDRKYCPC